MPGKATEDWPLNLIDLDREEHQRGHVQGWDYEVLWGRKNYSVFELMVLAALGEHPKATMYPLVRKRAEWALERLGDEARADLALLLPQMLVVGVESFKAFAAMTGYKPIPGWI